MNCDYENTIMITVFITLIGFAVIIAVYNLIYYFIDQNTMIRVNKECLMDVYDRLKRIEFRLNNKKTTKGEK